MMQHLGVRHDNVGSHQCNICDCMAIYQRELVYHLKKEIKAELTTILAYMNTGQIIEALYGSM